MKVRKSYIFIAVTYDRKKSKLYQLLLSEGKYSRLPVRQVVNTFNDQTRLYLIKSGYVKRYLLTKEGRKSIGVLYGPADIFPLPPAYMNIYKLDIYTGSEQYYYETMSPAEVFSISQDHLGKELKTHPEIYKDLFYTAGLRLNFYIHRLESMALRSAKRALLHQLVYLADTFGEHTKDGIVIEMPLTHQLLADTLDLARETISIEMAKLQKKGFIQTKKQLIIPDIDQLRDLIS